MYLARPTEEPGIDSILVLSSDSTLADIVEILGRRSKLEEEVKAANKIDEDVREHRRVYDQEKGEKLAAFEAAKRELEALENSHQAKMIEFEKHPGFRDQTALKRLTGQLEDLENTTDVLLSVLKIINNNNSNGDDSTDGEEH